MLGLVAEYNPFHNGHKLHINTSKELTNNENCIVVMSGNFVQRGEPAILDKYTRTKMALLNGADLVLELPVVFATSSAELFALGSVDILNKTGIVKNICFGSEEGNLDKFNEIVRVLTNEPNNFKDILKSNLNNGMSFPKARTYALEKYLSKNLDFMKEPNNILSIEYLKALKKLDTNIVPKTIKREISSFHSTKMNGEIVSATAIRNAIKTLNINNMTNTDFESIKLAIPKNCYEILEKFNYLPSIDDYSQVLSYLLRTTDLETLRNVADITEGLENRILNNVENMPISRLIDNIKSKRYTHTKLTRALLHIILNITKEDESYLKNNLSPYIRVLGFNKKSNVLSELTRYSKVPVITNLKNAKNILNNDEMYFLDKEIYSTDVYYLGKNKPIKYEYSKQLVIV